MKTVSFFFYIDSWILFYKLDTCLKLSWLSKTRMKLKIEQLIHSEKVKTAKLDSVNEEKSRFEIVLANSEEANKALETKETEQRKTVQKLELK